MIRLCEAFWPRSALVAAEEVEETVEEPGREKSRGADDDAGQCST